MQAIDGDSHFMEPLDLFEKFTDAKYRDRVMRVEKDAAGAQRLVCDGKVMQILDVDELLSAVVAYGQKETGRDIDHFDQYLVHSADWQDMDKRIGFLNAEGIDAQVIYPTLGLLWEGDVDDPFLADALCRAYNTWAFELCATHADRLFPAAHISLRDSRLAVAEMQRVAKLGCRTIFLAAMPIDGRSWGHPDFDPVWAAAQDLDLSVGIHLAANKEYTGSQFYRDRDPGFMYVTMNIIQDPRQCLTTMLYDGVFERFPKLRVATIEAMAGWVGEWLERFEYRYKYMKVTSRMKRSPREYFARNVWINGDPEEQMFPLIVPLAGDDKFFVGSDYPHAEGFVEPMKKARDLLSALPDASVRKILVENARTFFGI